MFFVDTLPFQIHSWVFLVGICLKVKIHNEIFLRRTSITIIANIVTLQCVVQISVEVPIVTLTEKPRGLLGPRDAEGETIIC